LAFHVIRKQLSDACELCIPLPEDVFFLVTDASGLCIKAVIQV